MLGLSANQITDFGFYINDAGGISMLSTDFSIVAHWLSGLESYLPAILVTIGAALLLGCGVSALCSPCREKDDIFHRHAL
jgi:hypothetical protein